MIMTGILIINRGNQIMEDKMDKRINSTEAVITPTN